MGRRKLDPEEKLTAINALVKKKIFKVIEKNDCKDIAELAIEKEYNKRLKNK